MDRKRAQVEIKKHREHLKELVNERTRELLISQEKEHEAYCIRVTLSRQALILLLLSVKMEYYGCDMPLNLLQVFHAILLLEVIFRITLQNRKSKRRLSRSFQKWIRKRLSLASEIDPGNYRCTLQCDSIQNEAGEIEGVFAAARDVTERKRNED